MSNITITDCNKGCTKSDECRNNFYSKEDDKICEACNNFIYDNGLATCKYLTMIEGENIS